MDNDGLYKSTATKFNPYKYIIYRPQTWLIRQLGRILDKENN